MLRLRDTALVRSSKYYHRVGNRKSGRRSRQISPPKYGGSYPVVGSSAPGGQAPAVTPGASDTQMETRPATFSEDITDVVKVVGIPLQAYGKKS
ncbi:uncharacterized protein PGTG_22295 [Puccinia graminis f. sp. tritici CRL 75-36-700-3]|uniref:Uncharacterized protein n=1 Tax=Puccinia graminis f. sp. tritici (strain CRL 75-36-700-3 / race SCCL) TaxID=418459 RepID=H6QU15_PUCGT|nr:uncharacterized protein PGTG_22295 [Puccinia graminis f. sp. tritici CRL 75-36-700-3]EHS64424.1 hypothetical protein PGTG_22295 [Puccinia graminis f. sp. tritici CRL 75-36-700-3]